MRNINNDKRLYSIYHNMKNRCYYKKSNRYCLYGGKGIQVCDEWYNSYKAFKKWAYDNGYNSNLTIDRIDNNGNYEPNNCRWVNYKEQSRNYSRNVIITYKGESKPLCDWAEKLGIKYGTLYRRLIIKKMDIDKAFNKPVQRKEK